MFTTTPFDNTAGKKKMLSMFSEYFTVSAISSNPSQMNFGTREIENAIRGSKHFPVGHGRGGRESVNFRKKLIVENQFFLRRRKCRRIFS